MMDRFSGKILDQVKVKIQKLPGKHFFQFKYEAFILHFIK